MSNRTALVTGSSRGIGKAIALQLAEDGFDVVLHCRSRVTDAEEVASLIKQKGGNARVLCFDIADRTQTKQVLESDMDTHGAYYAVVSNAGITRDNAFPAMTGDEWDSVIHTNLDSFYNVLNPIVMPMVRAKQGGRIVTLASVSGLMGNRGQANYSAAKAGVMAATKTLALELAKRKITVNCVAPGIIDTDMVADIPDEAMKMVPARRMGKPEEVAGLVGYLCSDNAAYITRQVISVNGGMM